MDLKGIIFDCDGVLVDSELVSAKVWERIVKEYGSKLSAGFLKNKFVGGTIPSSVAYIKEHVDIPCGIDIESIYRSEVSIAYNSELLAIEGIENVLVNLNLPKCIASNGPYDYIIEKINITRLADYFDTDLIFSAHDVGAFKPDPTLFLHAAKQLNLKPSECIVIEDSIHGLEAAKNAGIKCLHYVEGSIGLEFDGAYGTFGHMDSLNDFLLNYQNHQ